jgi:hypothetical protein
MSTNGKNARNYYIRCFLGNLQQYVVTYNTFDNILKFRLWQHKISKKIKVFLAGRISSGKHVTYDKNFFFKAFKKKVFNKENKTIVAVSK